MTLLETLPAPRVRADHDRAPAVATATLATAMLAVLYATSVLTEAGQLYDTWLMNVVADGLRGTDWTELVLWLVSPELVAGGAAVLGLVAYATRGVAGAITVLGTVLGTIVTAEVLKLVLVRPQLLDDAANSMPSGHVAVVAGLAVATATIARPASRWLVVSLGSAAVALTGVATLALQWHRLSDVIASVLVAVGVGAVCVATVEQW